jgi:hypothetical protein
VGDKYLIGEKMVLDNFEPLLTSCWASGCVCQVASVNGITPYPPQSGDFVPSDKTTIQLPFVGEVNVGSMSLVMVTALIGLLDGVNPCSLWVITFLLGIVIYSGSRKKVLIVGITFLLVGAIAYVLFMIGLLNVFSYIAYLKWIQLLVAFVAIAFALINIKDYFWYKKGISLTISDKYKPKFFANARNLMKLGDNIPALIIGTITLALGVTLAELPCTVGLPVIWTNILVSHHVGAVDYGFLLALYMALFFLDEIVVFSSIAITLRVSRFEEKHGRVLKLFGGMIMLGLGATMLIRPSLMNSLTGSFSVFAGAVAASLLIMWVTKAHRKPARK